MSKPLTFLFKVDGLVPNNAGLPALLYKAAIDPNSRDLARAIEKHFAANGWGRDQWRDGIYPFVHYHSMIHEALGIAHVRARVQLGGHQGETLEFSAGDVAVLPAGTGHQRLYGSDDLLVIGAYPAEGTTISAAATIRPSATRRLPRSRKCRCRKAIRSPARTAR